MHLTDCLSLGSPSLLYLLQDGVPPPHDVVAAVVRQSGRSNASWSPSSKNGEKKADVASVGEKKERIPPASPLKIIEEQAHDIVRVQERMHGSLSCDHGLDYGDEFM